MNETQQRIFNYVKWLCSSCCLMSSQGDILDNVPVLTTVKSIADKLGLSERTVQRNLEWLVNHNYIYRVEHNRSYIYSTQPINLNNDFLCRVRLSS